MLHDNTITVASTVTLTSELAGKLMEMMLDSRSAVLLVIKKEANKLQNKLTNIPIPHS